MAKLRERFRFDLSYALACDVKMFAHFFKRPLLARLIEAEAHLDYLLLARRKRREHVFGKLSKIIRDRSLRRVGRATVFDEAGDGRLAVVANRCLKRDRLLRDLQRFADLPGWHINPASKLFVSRFAAKFLDHQALSPKNLVNDFDHMNRHA